MRNDIPEDFKPILWSYDLERLDPETHRKTIIVQTINYGTLGQWRWLRQRYGLDGVRQILRKIPATELRPRARRLASLLFGVSDFNHARRGAH